MSTNTHLGRASFTGDLISLRYWHASQISGSIISGSNFMDLSQKVSRTIGTMKPTPVWLSQGMVVAIVGG